MKMQKILQTIAKENGITVEQARAQMQAAINAAWHNPYKTPEQEEMQRRFSKNGEPPSVEEFIRLSAKELQNF